MSGPDDKWNGDFVSDQVYPGPSCTTCGAETMMVYHCPSCGSTPHEDSSLCGRAMVILKALSLSVKWELAPEIKVEIDAICHDFEKKL